MTGKNTRHWFPALAGPLLTALLVAGSLAGCAGPAPELDGAAATQLQSQVRAVTEAAAAEDSPGALKLLDDLMTKLEAAAADGKVSFKRHQSIKASVDAVRADLNAKVAQQQAAEAAKAAAAAQAAQEAAAKAAADQAAQAPAPAPVENGKAKGKGKGGG